MDSPSAFTLILPLQGTAIRHTADSFLLTRGLASPARTIETLSVSISRNYTVASDAVWLGPWGAVRPDLDSCLLVQLPVNMAGSEELVGLTLRADKAATPAQQEVINTIHALAAERQQSGLAPA